MMEEIERVGYDTLEHFLTTFDQSVVEGKFIGAAVIEFVRQFDTERGNRYAQHRLDYIARQEEKHRRLAAERAEKAAQKEAQRKAAEQAARAKYLGWADQMTAMQFGKVSSVLDALIRVDGKVMTKREFVISRMKDGWTPTKKRALSATMGAVGMSRRVSHGRSTVLQKKISHTGSAKRSSISLRIWQHILRNSAKHGSSWQFAQMPEESSKHSERRLRKHETWNYRGKKV